MENEKIQPLEEKIDNLEVAVFTTDIKERLRRGPRKSYFYDDDEFPGRHSPSSAPNNITEGRQPLIPKIEEPEKNRETAKMVAKKSKKLTRAKMTGILGLNMDKPKAEQKKRKRAKKAAVESPFPTPLQATNDQSAESPTTKSPIATGPIPLGQWQGDIPQSLDQEMDITDPLLDSSLVRDQDNGQRQPEAAVEDDQYEVSLPMKSQRLSSESKGGQKKRKRSKKPSRISAPTEETWVIAESQPEPAQEKESQDQTASHYLKVPVLPLRSPAKNAFISAIPPDPPVAQGRSCIAQDATGEHQCHAPIKRGDPIDYVCATCDLHVTDKAPCYLVIRLPTCAPCLKKYQDLKIEISDHHMKD